MTPRLRLRRFLYLDGALTESAMSQTGADIYDEEAQTQRTERSRRLGAGVKAGPAQAEAGGDRGLMHTASRTVRLTPEAAFTRLVELLEGEGAVQYLEALDQDIWDDLRRGEVIEAECNIAIPLLLQLGFLLQSQSIDEIASAFGATLDDATRKGIQQLGAVLGMLKVFPVICELAGSPRYKFVVPINPNPACLRVMLDDLNGEATVFATVEKKLKGREKWTLIDAIGLGVIPRSARRDVDRDLAKVEGLRDFTVTAPAAVLSPIAIYR